MIITSASPVWGWGFVRQGTSAFFDAAKAVAIDRGGDVVVAGYMDEADIVDGFAAKQFTVRKLSGATGTERWAYALLPADSEIGARAFAVAIDAAGDVIAAGFTSTLPFGRSESDLVVVKLAGSDGSERWRRIVRGASDLPLSQNIARAMALDAAGDVLVAGLTDADVDGENVHRFTVLKLRGADGVLVWMTLIPGDDCPDFEFGDIDSARAVAVDAAGDVVAAGAISDACPLTNLAVVKLAGTDGQVVWARQFTGNAGRAEGRLRRRFEVLTDLEFDDGTRESPIVDDIYASEAADAVAIDGAGDVFAAGFDVEPGESRDFAIVKLAAANGDRIWGRAIDGPPHRLDRAFAVALDGVGDVVAAGYLGAKGPFPASSLTVIKFAGMTGEERWRENIVGETRTRRHDVNRAFAVAIDGAGDVATAGIFTDAGNHRRFGLAKIAGVDGRLTWGFRFTGPPAPPIFTFDQAFAVAADAAGDIVAAGTMGSRFAVVKRKGTTGEDFVGIGD